MSSPWQACSPDARCGCELPESVPSRWPSASHQSRPRRVASGTVYPYRPPRPCSVSHGFRRLGGPNVLLVGRLASVRKVPEHHPALDWLARRHAGESAALIAQRAGVSEAVVRRDTKAYGPFPRPTQQVNRTTVSDDVLSARTDRWVEARRRGRAPTAIAREEGVSHQLVSKATRDHGPYPAPATVQAWADARRAGQPVEAIAAAYDVRASVIRRHTAPLGPFRGQGPHLPDGVLGVTAIAERAGVSGPTVLRWQSSGRLPEPDFVTPRAPALAVDDGRALARDIGRPIYVQSCAVHVACRSRITPRPSTTRPSGHPSRRMRVTLVSSRSRPPTTRSRQPSR